MDKKPLNIAFWLKDSGNALSHGQGLTKEQVEALKDLKEGDRLIMFSNKEGGETRPNYSLKVFKGQRNDDGGL